jgi:solute carrier family 25 protein 38
MSKDQKPNIFKIAFSSLISSSIGPVLNNPFDVVKTRFMNPKYNYKTLQNAFSDIVKNDGYRYLFKGLGLRLFRVSGGQVIIFITIENLMYYT